MNHLTRSQTPHYKIRLDSWQRLCELRGWSSTADAARAIGVHNTALYRGFTGCPGAHIMAAIQAAAPRTWPMDMLFQLVVPSKDSAP